MATNGSDTAESLRTYGNWRRPRSAGMYGLGKLGTVFLVFSLIVVVIISAVAGLAKALMAGVVLLGLVMVLVTRDKHGRNLLSRITARLGWSYARSKGAHLYRSGPLGRAAWGTFQLPGLAAPSRLSEWHDSYGRPFALIHVPATRHYTVVLASDPDGSALVDQEQVDTWVANWGMWLAAIAEQPDVEAVSVTVETAPATSARLHREISGRVDPDSPDLAQAVLDEIVQTYPAHASTTRAYVAITCRADTRSGGKKRDAEEMGRSLASRLPGLTLGLSNTGAGAARPMSAQSLCETIRIAYDPAVAIDIEEAHAAGDAPELLWSEVGPAAHETTWDTYRHSSATSVTWGMSTAPHGNVQSHVLGRLLAPQPDIDRKRVTLLYRPIDPARAAAIVEADIRAEKFRATSSERDPTERDTRAVAAARATAAEEAAGAGLVNFGMLVTATITDRSKLADVHAAIDHLAPTARVRLRRLDGFQDSAFAAALPLGLVLPQHTRVPQNVRENL